MEDLAREMVAFLEGGKVKSPLFPPRREFDILCSQYGVNYSHFKQL
jgi:hypothetical protein